MSSRESPFAIRREVVRQRITRRTSAAYPESRNAIESDGSATATLKSPNSHVSENKPIEHYIEVAGHRYMATFLTLTQSMPCSIIVGDWLCGRGATLGGVIPNPDGTWLL